MVQFQIEEWSKKIGKMKIKKKKKKTNSRYNIINVQNKQ